MAKLFIFASFLALVLGYPAQAQIAYNPETNTIEVEGLETKATLTLIDNALKNKSLLERSGSFEWLLKANLRIFEGATLELEGIWLKLESGPAGYVTLEGSNGNIFIENAKITSWDSGKDDFDKEFLDGSGRAFISAKNRSSAFINRMNVIDSEIAYLGFFEETAYGISWKVISEPGRGDTGTLGKSITGLVSNSKFHHNYIGVYVWGGGDMEVRNNEIYENYRYGFDAHTQAQRTIVEDNFSHDNGWHGIIFADRCIGNIIRRNRVEDNKGHGIMLHEFSDGNTIEFNTIVGGDDGIPLFESSNNTIINNTIEGANNGVRVYGRAGLSRENLFENNEISRSLNNGVYLYEGAMGNIFTNNRISSNGGNGVYLTGASDNVFTENAIGKNENGVQIDYGGLKEFSQNNKWEDNTVSDNSKFGFLVYSPQRANDIQNNRFSNNRSGDIHYPDPQGSGFTLRLAEERNILIFIGIIMMIIIISILIALFINRR